MKTQSFAPAEQSGSDSLPIEWIILNGHDEQDRAWIDKQSGFDEAVKAIVSMPPTHVRRVHLGTEIILTLARRDSTTRNDPTGLTMVIDTHRLVTVCYGTDAIVEEALDRQTTGSVPAGISRILSLLVAALIRPLDSEITLLSDRIDALEDQAMKASEDGMDDAVVLIGRRALSLRRYLAPMHDEVSYLALNPDELPGSVEAKSLRRAAESLARLVSALDSSHNRVLLILDQLKNRDVSRQARSMHKLTLVATVFLPLTFITGLLGINVAGIPDAHNPLGFWVVCGILLGVAVLAILLIRWRKWM
ncbi:MAG: hypothetical protein LJE97_10375 [Betaproteobacteria bacterium]|nr:hypothetical protein [Betaproteobacteria bacterium]